MPPEKVSQLTLLPLNRVLRPSLGAQQALRICINQAEIAAEREEVIIKPDLAHTASLMADEMGKHQVPLEKSFGDNIKNH